MVFIFVLFLIFYIYHLDYNFYNYDEGTNLYASWELSQGKLPYRDFFFVYFPSIHIAMGYLFNKFGVSIFLARILSVIFAFFTAFWVFYFSVEFSKKFFPALFSFSLFLLNTYTLIFARGFLPLFFWVFLALTSVYFVYKFLAREKKWTIFTAGVLLGMSAYIKLLAMAFFISIVLILSLKRKFKAIIYFLSGFALTFIFPVIYLFIKFYPQIWEMAFKFHFLQREHYLFIILEDLFRHNFYLFILGLPFILGYRWSKNPLDDLLFFLVMVLFMFPAISGKFIWFQYFYPLIPIFSIICSRSISRINKFNLYSILICLFAILACGYYFRKDIRYFQRWKRYDIATINLVEFIKNHTTPEDYILCEYLYINILSGRENPPELADISHTRIISQRITPEYIIDVCEKYNVKVIIYRVRSVPFRLDLIAIQPEFRNYLNKRFHLVGDWRRNYDVLRVFIRKR
ncbi:MAG: hypothetical protein B6D53_03160 [Candidatus Omnitrophica bacterium 4484_49]|nr:MAG: hypothetical protein B6D53_03160 [Candidatus Omnitrophica bacterium 4484_49]